MAPVDIWQAAYTPLPPQDGLAVITVGTVTSGKSTVLHALMHKLGDDNTSIMKPTIGLEYTFKRYARKSTTQASINTNTNANANNTLTVHFWEVGGGKHLVGLLDIALKTHHGAEALLLMVVDLSRPQTVVNEINEWVKLVKKAKYYKPSMPIVMVANKYDAMQHLEPGERAIMAKTLRSLALKHGATLIYLSRKNNDTLKVLEKIFNQHRAQQPLSLPLMIDHNSFIVVTAGTDSSEKIGLPERSQSGGLISTDPAQAWTAAHNKIWPPEPAEKPLKKLGIDQGEFAEKRVDQAIAQANEEFERRKQQMALERKLRKNELPLR